MILETFAGETRGAKKYFISAFIGLLLYQLVLVFLFPYNGEIDYVLMARGIHEGFWPYLFADSHKTPGTGIFLSLVFCVLPNNMIMARLVIFVVNLAACRLLWKTAEQFAFSYGEKWFAVLLYAFLLPCYVGTDVRAEQFVALIALFSLYLFMKRRMDLEEAPLGGFALLGVLLFGCFIFKQVGILYLGAFGLFIALQALFGEIKLWTAVKRAAVMGLACFALIGAFFFFYYLIGHLAFVVKLLFGQVYEEYPNGFQWADAASLFLFQVPLLWVLAAVGGWKAMAEAWRSKKTSFQLLVAGLALAGLAPLTQRCWNHYSLQALVFVALAAGLGFRAAARSAFLKARPALACGLAVLLCAPALLRIPLNGARLVYFLAKERPAAVEFQPDPKNPLKFYTIWNELALAKKIRSEIEENEKVAMYSDHRYYYYGNIYPHGPALLTTRYLHKTLPVDILAEKIRTVIILNRNNFEDMDRLLKEYFPESKVLRESPSQVTLYRRNVPPPIYSKDNYRYKANY